MTPSRLAPTATSDDRPEWMKYIRPDELLDVVAVSSAEAGKLLGVDGDTIGRLMQRGELRWVLVGSRRRIRLSEIRRYLDSQEASWPRLPDSQAEALRPTTQRDRSQRRSA